MSSISMITTSEEMNKDYSLHKLKRTLDGFPHETHTQTKSITRGDLPAVCEG